MNLVSHRAGRWAINEIYLSILTEFNYSLDCSYTPYINWSEMSDDYKNAGFKMLPSISKNLDSTLFQIVFFVMALIGSSIGIYLLNLTSFIYMFGAVILGIVFLIHSANILFEQSSTKIKKLFIFSIIYLPLLMLLIIFDTLFL